MHYLWLFRSRNRLICTHANERKGWRLGGEEREREMTDWMTRDKSDGKHTWMRSHRRQCCRGGHCRVYEVSPVCGLPISDSKDSVCDSATTPIHLLKSPTVRAYFSVQDLLEQAEYHNAQIVVSFANLESCVFGKVFITDHETDSSAKWLTIFCLEALEYVFLYWLRLKYKHAKVVSAWKGESIK